MQNCLLGYLNLPAFFFQSSSLVEHFQHMLTPRSRTSSFFLGTQSISVVSVWYQWRSHVLSALWTAGCPGPRLPPLTKEALSEADTSSLYLSILFFHTHTTSHIENHTRLFYSAQVFVHGCLAQQPCRLKTRGAKLVLRRGHLTSLHRCTVMSREKLARTSIQIKAVACDGKATCTHTAKLSLGSAIYRHVTGMYHAAGMAGEAISATSATATRTSGGLLLKSDILPHSPTVIYRNLLKLNYHRACTLSTEHTETRTQTPKSSHNPLCPEHMTGFERAIERNRASSDSI